MACHNQLAAQIISQVQLEGSNEKFCVVFAAIGVKHDSAIFFEKSF